MGEEVRRPSEQIQPRISDQVCPDPNKFSAGLHPCLVDFLRVSEHFYAPRLFFFFFLLQYLYPTTSHWCEYQVVLLGVAGHHSVQFLCTKPVCTDWVYSVPKSHSTTACVVSDCDKKPPRIKPCDEGKC